MRHLIARVETGHGKKIINEVKMKFSNLNITSACLFITKDPEWRRKIFIGGLVLLIPLVGWTMLLGYRKVAVNRLWLKSEPLLPEWKNNFIHYFIEGFKCSLIIFIYLLPATVLFWFIVFYSNLISQVPWLEIIVVLCIYPLFTPLVLPFTVFYLMIVPFNPLPILLGFLIIVIYFGLVFLIPLGFIQVSITGRYLSAFNVLDCGRFWFNNFFNYLEAWIDSSIISLLGHFCIPFSPWGVLWAYLGIVYNFNEVLYLDGGKRENIKNPEIWFNSFSKSFWESNEIKSNGNTSRYRINSENEFSTIKLGKFQIPLPRMLEMYL